MDQRRADPPARRGATLAAASAALLPGRHRSAVTGLRQELRAADRTIVAPGSGAHGHVRSGSAAPVELLPRLLASAGNEAVLVDQMLLDCCRLLLRAPGNSPIDVAELRRNLQECRSYLEEQHVVPDAAATDDQLHAVRDLLTIADFRVLSKPQEPQAAWERLSEDLARPVVRHGLEAGCCWSALSSRTSKGCTFTRIRESGGGGLGTCVRQLEERALANLPPLRQILAGDFVSDWLGRRDQRRLLTLARPDVGELRAVTDRLHTLAHGPWRPGDPSWRAVRRELLDRINWWNPRFQPHT